MEIDNNDNGKFLYFDFSDLLPDDNFFYNSFASQCMNLGYSRVLADWGSSFPWSIDKRLVFQEHLDEKTITAFDTNIKNKNFCIIPLFPFIGGMEFLLSFFSYKHLRLEGNYSSIDPEAAGAESFLKDIIDDYTSIFSNTRYAAFNLTMAYLLNSNNIKKAVSQIISDITDENNFEEIFLVGYRASLEVINNIKYLINNDNIRIFIIDKTETDFIKNKIETATPFFYIEDKNKEIIYKYEKELKKAWDIIIFLKTVLNKTQYKPCLYYNISTIFSYYKELVDIFSKIGKTVTIIKEALAGRLNKGSLDNYFNSRLALIKTEMMKINCDIENINSSLKGEV